jgi:metal-responsive CopG/Arc/MetJ family transcriptional regulator
MRTAVSIPDDLFRRAEATARRLKLSRSKLYATAISDFLERQREDSMTERLNAVYSRQSGKVDPAFRRAQFLVLDKESG